jgi:hypothetical protein
MCIIRPTETERSTVNTRVRDVLLAANEIFLSAYFQVIEGVVDAAAEGQASSKRCMPRLDRTGGIVVPTWAKDNRLG